ncbi:Nn.00g108800.m01.CDS01 [Neocucurbitaria sp. VM-36]
MDSERPHLSITLPRNFMFHYRDGPSPRTPEPESQPEVLQPPPPPRQVLKVRRRRTTLVMNHDEMDNTVDQRPIPTIETPELLSEASMELPSFAPPQDDAFLSPGIGYTRMLSPPKTPVAQMRTISNYDGPQLWDDVDQASQSETSSRPTSSSGFSDSSISSCDSIGSFMSRCGSCTSPEEEMTDPFLYCSPAIDYNGSTSPLAAHQQLRPAKKLKLRATFTEEMDYHLWMTYMKYLQDPTVTPFKALPSTVPPNGVCHRVARMARKTWKGPRPSRSSGPRANTRYSSRSGTPDTIKPTKSGSSTPVARPSKSFLRYPSEKQCRKRLRDLAKQKPTLSAHYQRLLHRSPSPFQSSPPDESSSQPRPLSSPFSQGSTAFSTRDMNLSLATSTAASMQLGNPLSQLASDNTPRPIERTWSSVRSSAHQKSQSLHIGLGLGLGNVLGSPFNGTFEMADASTNQHNARTWHAPSSSSQPTRLGSPFQLHAPRPMSRVFKRRALHSFEDKARTRGDSFVNELFGAPAESSHRRVRSRGFSLGDMMEGARRLPLANDPSGFNPFANLSSTMPSPARHSPAMSVEAQGQATVRLGSPFGGRSSNTFPRATISHSFEPPTSFEQRFAAMPSDPAYLHRS